jgi:hypothetical protein
VTRWLLLLSLALAAAPRAADWTLTVVAPVSLESAAGRIRSLDPHVMADALQRAGLALPPRLQVTLIPEDDPRATAVPPWFVGLASGAFDIAIFPDRVRAYPYDSLESVMRHEVVHLALSAAAGGRPLPRWFHEGVAVSVESGWGVDDRLRLIIAGFSGPPLDDVTRLFASDARPDTTQAYLLAAALVDELRRTHGATFPGRVAARVAAGAEFANAFETETGVAGGSPRLAQLSPMDKLDNAGDERIRLVGADPGTGVRGVLHANVEAGAAPEAVERRRSGERILGVAQLHRSMVIGIPNRGCSNDQCDCE